MRSWRLVAVIIAALGLGVLVMLLLTEDPSSVDHAANPHVTSNSGAPSNPTSPLTRSPAPSETADASTSPTASPTASGPRIETSTSEYFGSPFETIQIAGWYRGVGGSTELRVQLRQPSGWTTFPLPAVTQPSGKFRAYVELGRGQYRLRIVDPETGTTSGVLTLLVF